MAQPQAMRKVSTVWDHMMADESIMISSVLCERVFSTAGEVISKNYNRFNFKTLEKRFFFFNQNLWK